MEAELAQAAPDADVRRRRSAPASPALLEQYLAMPRARLIVDGYNVSKTAWPSSSLEAQRIRLLTGAGAAGGADRRGDDRRLRRRRDRPPAAGGRTARRTVLFSPRGVIADDVIRDLVAAEPDGRVVVVVTSDQEVVRDVVRRRCARSSAPDALLELLSAGSAPTRRVRRAGAHCRWSLGPFRT